MTLTRDLPADATDREITDGLAELEEQFRNGGGNEAAMWSQVTGLPDGGGYRLAVSDETPPWM